jgi:uroporphyrinogen-III synthase
MRVLITRPQPDALELAALCEQQSITPCVFPTTKFVVAPDVKKLTFNPAPEDIIIFVSKPAVTYAAQAFDLTQFESQFVAVGQGTAALLQQVGVKQVTSPEQHNSEGMLQLSELQHVKNKTIYIVRGQDGRELLAQALTERGALIQYVEVYQRHCASPDAAILQNACAKKLDAIVATSRSSLENLLKLATPQTRAILQKTPVTIMSKTMLHFATHQGFTRFIPLESAQNSHIIDVLKKDSHG